VLNRNYNYGWQSVIADSPWLMESDPRYDSEMARQAKEMFRRWRKPRAPDLPEPKIHTAEEIAHVVACGKLIKLYLDHGEARRQAIRRGVSIPAPLSLIDTARMAAAEIERATTRLSAISTANPTRQVGGIEAVQQALGISAKEQSQPLVETDPAVREMVDGWHKEIG
jgi:hypothetical protein